MSNIKQLFIQFFKWLLITVLIGLLSGSASAFFLTSLEFITNYREAHSCIIVLLPFAGLCIGLLYHKYGKDVEAGSAIVFDNIKHPRSIIPIKLAPFVYLGTIVTHMFGGSAGREGTALQMSAALADRLTKSFKLDKESRKLLLICAIAAGFGSVFGTPIAGAIFSVEVVRLGTLRFKAIFPAVLCAFCANFVTQLWQVGHTNYYITTVPKINFQVLFFSIVAGVFFGLCAQFFIKGMHWSTSLMKSCINYIPLRTFVGGLVIMVAILCLGTTKYIGLGIPVIVESFNNKLPLYTFFIKMLLTIVTISSGFKGGEVTPLFFIGATLGNALSYFIPMPIGLLSGMGFVAVFAGATNTPIACIIMAIELFGVNSSIFIVVSCILSYIVSGKGTIYKV